MLAESVDKVTRDISLADITAAVKNDKDLVVPGIVAFLVIYFI